MLGVEVNPTLSCHWASPRRIFFRCLYTHRCKQNVYVVKREDFKVGGGRNL